MIDRFFRWLEGYVDPFPPETPQQPPARLLPFAWHYTKPFLPLLIASVLFSAVIASIEIYLFGYLGRLVDLLASANRETLWADYGTEFLVIGLVALLALPALNFISESISHQGLRAGFAMRIRWTAHRYVLRQSMDFFTNDYAGRVATKVMQTALGIRDAVMKLTEVIVYVSVYFVGALILVATADLWLMIPLLLWLVGYGAACWYFVPRMGKLSEAQADMRSMVTGRVVDSYTNISTVKLFAHADREDGFAKEGMGWMLEAVNRSMRMSTMMTASLQLLSGFLIFTMAGTSIYLWQQNAITTGAIAFAIGLTLRLKAMSQWIIWEVAGLFEDIGVIHDGIATVARERSIADKPGALPLAVVRGAINFQTVRFNYGRKDETRGHDVVDGLSLNIKAGEKVGLVGRSGAGKSTLANLLLRFYDLQSGSILIDGQNIAGVTQDSLRAAIGVVTQDTSLLHRAVIDNIRYGRPDATQADVELAARKAHADEFIAGLVDPQGPHRLCRPRWRARREAFRRPAPARSHRPRIAEERTHPGARRSHLSARFRSGSGHPGKSLHLDGRQDSDRRRPSAFNHRRHGPPGGHGPGPHRRGRQPPRLAQERRPLRQSVAASVRWFPCSGSGGGRRITPS